ncbi:MAG: aminotransferase class V-fold PLP-dependent enzyme [Chlamydiae bacterium]|nr:aminotransferase class V-fold PLP-dependent enzyme [Chlamydiota bacterium]
MAKRRLHPLILGGTGSDTINDEILSEKEFFKEMGTPNFPAIAALVDSLEYATSNWKLHRELEDRLVTQFVDGIERIGGIKIIKGAADQVAIVALRPEFGSPELHWAPYLRSQNIIVRGGLHCSALYHQQLDLSQRGTLRVSFGWDSKAEHVVKALKCIEEFCHIAKEVFHDTVA